MILLRCLLFTRVCAYAARPDVMRLPLKGKIGERETRAMIIRALIRRILDDSSLMQQLCSMPRQAAYYHLFIRLNLTLDETEAILKQCFPS